jgi:hypothetical protein
MDRIDTYIQQAFAKFRDVPEIQAQKEEMADHLRDRIADAIGQGKSEKEAFASVSAAMSDAMPDLEQTLAEFLRPEFLQRVPPKPNTKDIYINFYRYHRAMMLMFVQVLLALIVLARCEVLSHQGEELWPWINGLLAVTAYFNLGLGICVVCSIVAYLWKPLHVKRVTISPWRLMGKFCIGAILITVFVLVCWYALVLPDDVDGVFEFILYSLLYYSVFFIMFCWLGWFRQHRYTKAPDFEQDTLLAKWGIGLTAVILIILLLIQASFMDSLIRYQHFSKLQQHMPGEITRLHQTESDLKRQLSYTQKQLNAVTGEQMPMPRDGFIAGEPPMNFDRSGRPARQMVRLDLKRQPALKAGVAAGVFDPAIGDWLWAIPGATGESKILDNSEINRRMKDSGGMSSSSSMGGGMMMGMGGMGSMPGGGMGTAGTFEPLEPKEHHISLDGDFPATDLAENVICAMQFPFEDYKLGMIQAVAAAETLNGDEASTVLTVRLGVGNLDSRNAKLLLTVEYDDALRQADIPSGATLFLGFLAAREYREYKVDFTVTGDAEHSIRFTLRNESGLVIAQTEVVQGKATSDQVLPPAEH